MVGAILAVACASATPADNAPTNGEARVLAARIAPFYEALRGRPLDAFLTYGDPRLRGYFASEGDFTDWYASLANQVRAADLRYGRAEEVRIREIAFEDPDTARVVVVLRGPHERPLRLRDVEIERTDVWRRTGGTWLLTPDRL
jgi:hypothetical protein